MPQDLSAVIEAEIAALAQRLIEPGETECIRCYLLRMITEFGCDGTHRWTVSWRDLRAAQPGGLLRQLQLRGGSGCDCEVLLNVFPDYPPSAGLLPCAGVSRPGSARPCDLRALRKTA